MFPACWCAGQVVAANKLDAGSGGPISIIAGRVEEVEGIGHDKVGTWPLCCCVQDTAAAVGWRR
jgi:hypothetical protein